MSDNLQNLTIRLKREEDYRGEYKELKPWMPAFLASLADHGNISHACRAVGIARQTAYDAKETDATFAKLWEEALEDAVELLELAARQRALTVSDTLAIFLLKAHRPEKYRERYDVNVRSVKADKPVSEMTDQELADYERSLRNQS